MKNIDIKIHIIGSVGSGKTTLARKLSTFYKIPYYELDNVVWRRTASADVRRSEKARDEKLKSIIVSDSWIVEGVHHTWVSDSIYHADLIIFLDIPYRKRTYRIIRRFILQKLGREQANYKPTFKMLRKMFGWNAYFENKSKREILDLISHYQEKVLVLEDNVQTDQINTYLKKGERGFQG